MGRNIKAVKPSPWDSSRKRKVVPRPSNSKTQKKPKSLPNGVGAILASFLKEEYFTLNVECGTDGKRRNAYFRKNRDGTGTLYPPSSPKGSDATYVRGFKQIWNGTLYLKYINYKPPSNVTLTPIDKLPWVRKASTTQVVNFFSRRRLME